MTRDQFLVEQEGGCWHERVFKHNYNGTSCNCSKCGAVDSMGNPDFSKPGNFIRLLGLAEKNGIHIEINTKARTIVALKNMRYFPHEYEDITQIPDITATLIAQALGFEEVKK